MFRLFIVLVSVLVLSSCAIFGEYQSRHIQSTSLVQFLYPKGKLPLQDKKNPVLNLPLRVGLAFIPDKTRQSTLSAATKVQLLQKVKSAFVSKKYINEIIIIPDMYLQASGGYANLAQVQNLYQLDVIALVSYDQIVNTSDNLLSLSYLTIVGAYVLPGSNYKVSTMIDLAVIDVQSRSILFRAAGVSGSKNNVVAGAYAKQAYAKKQNQSFDLAMQQMQAQLFIALDNFEQRLREKDPNDRIQVRHRQGNSGGADSNSLLLVLIVFGMLKFRLRVHEKK